MILLTVWLILIGMLTAPFLKVSVTHSDDLLAVAITAGVVLMSQR